AQGPPPRLGPLLRGLEFGGPGRPPVGYGEPPRPGRPAFRLPAEPHGADPELLLDRDVQRVHIDEFVGGFLRDLGAEPVRHFLQQRTQSFGKYLDLLLLDRHADRADVLGGLQIERAVTGCPDRACTEAAAPADDMNDASHGIYDPQPPCWRGSIGANLPESTSVTPRGGRALSRVGLPVD